VNLACCCRRRSDACLTAARDERETHTWLPAPAGASAPQLQHGANSEHQQNLRRRTRNGFSSRDFGKPETPSFPGTRAQPGTRLEGHARSIAPLEEVTVTGMQQRELFFVIPTYRLREVGKTNLLRIVDDVVSVIKGSLQLWPTLVEICYFQKGRKGLPRTRVKNQLRQSADAALSLVPRPANRHP
jgi:hypothetical protein